MNIKKFRILAMKSELKQLERKTSSLKNLIKNRDRDAFKDEIIDRKCDEMLDLTKKQTKIMKDYIDVLKERIKLFEDYGIDK